MIADTKSYTTEDNQEFFAKECLEEQICSDADILGISEYIAAKNKEAYDVLAR